MGEVKEPCLIPEKRSPAAEKKEEGGRAYLLFQRKSSLQKLSLRGSGGRNSKGETGTVTTAVGEKKEG